MKRITPEASLLSVVIRFARLRGWLVTHSRPGRTAHGWRTPIQGDPGYPDLTLIRNGRLVFAELKSDTGKVRQEQRVWLSCLVEAPGVECYVWRPGDWPEIEDIMR